MTRRLGSASDEVERVAFDPDFGYYPRQRIVWGRSASAYARIEWRRSVRAACAACVVRLRG